MVDFVCPECSNALLNQGDLLACSSCNSEWTIDEYGIPQFAQREFWWNQVDREATSRIVSIAANKGWRSALDEGLLPLAGDYVYRYASLESRADWHFLLNLGLSAKILDIGCGWGPTVMQLARHYEEVHGVDANELTLRFVRLRARQEGLDNVVLARVDPLEWSQLPYEDETFDLVVMNGVLEWIGAARDEEAPDIYQRKALLEIRRVLKPKGLLYVGIENRFAYSSFLGAKSHSGIPFADILPRPLADLVCRMSGNSIGFRTYTYSLYGYQRIFSDCGYMVRQVLFPFPDYRFPSSIIPLSEPEFMSYWARNQLSRRYSCLLQPMILLRLAPLLAYSYAMIIEKRELLHGR